MRQIQRGIEMLNEHRLDEHETLELTQLEGTIERGLKVFWEVGEALFTIRDKRLYRVTHVTFDAYCRERWGMSKTQANRLIGAAEVTRDLTPIGVIPSSESVARPLVSLPTEQRQEVWQMAVDLAPDGKPTASDVDTVKQIKRASSAADILAEQGKSLGLLSRGDSILPESDRIDELTHTSVADVDDRPGTWSYQVLTTDTEKSKLQNHQLINASTNNEWYTPKQFIDAAREVMGAIDLDPASNDYANRVVQASKVFTIVDDGYTKKWQGRVWLNPPYGKEEGVSNQARWSAKLISEYEDGNVTEALLLVNASTGNNWFAPLWAYPICFVSSRIHF